MGFFGLGDDEKLSKEGRQIRGGEDGHGIVLEESGIKKTFSQALTVPGEETHLKDSQDKKARPPIILHLFP